MANPLLTRKADRSIAGAINAALRDRVFSGDDLVNVLRAAYDGHAVSDVEYRDLKRFIRTESRLAELDRVVVETFLALFYPLEGPFLYPGNVDDLEGTSQLGDGECAKLVQLSQPIGKANNWRAGIKVQGNGHVIARGTAVATFEDGLYPNRDPHTRDEGNHVAYYLSQDSAGIRVMDQYPQKDDVSSRVMPFKASRSNGLCQDPSNNGAALSVIMRKK